MSRAPDPEPRAVRTRPHRLRRRPVWLGPVSATAAVALVSGIVLALALHTAGSGRKAPASGLWVPTASGPAIAVSGPPRYYVDLENYGQTFVRSTATGEVTAKPLGPGGTSVAASADGRTFYVEWDETLYVFRLTAAGKAYGLAPVPGGQALGIAAQVMAVSPDGSEIALAGAPPHPQGALVAPVILVINLRTGVHTVWQGGPAESGPQLTISSLSWTNGGRSLVFLATWCAPFAETVDSCAGTSSIARGNHNAEVRALDPAEGGGPLDRGRLLLRQSAGFPYLAQALISGDGRTIIAAVLSGPENQDTLLPDDLSVVRISVATGRQVGVLYRGLVKSAVNLTADGSGQYLLQWGMWATGPIDGPCRP